MKNLQDYQEKEHSLTTSWSLKTIEFQPDNPKSLILLIHGYNERGLRIFRKLKRSLPPDSYIIAPNGPFPLPRVKVDRVDFGYAWYFFDKFTQSYQIDQTLCVDLLKSFLERVNPQRLPVTIIGFSQGGYLAPLLGFAYPEVKRVIGIGCEFKRRFFQEKPKFTLDAIHGADDNLVSVEHAKNEIDLLKKDLDIEITWHLLPNIKHEITTEVAMKVNEILELYGKAGL